MAEQENHDENDFDDRRSLGMITKLENFDELYAQKYLRKPGWVDIMGDQPTDLPQETLPNPETTYPSKDNFQSPPKNLSGRI